MHKTMFCERCRSERNFSQVGQASRGALIIMQCRCGKEEIVKRRELRALQTPIANPFGRRISKHNMTVVNIWA